MEPGRGHWAAGIATAVALHAGVAVALLWQPPDSGAPSTGLGGIEISLGPAGAAPGSIAAAVPQSVEAVKPESARTAAQSVETPVETVETETAETPIAEVEPPGTPVDQPSGQEPIEQVAPLDAVPERDVAEPEQALAATAEPVESREPESEVTRAASPVHVEAAPGPAPEPAEPSRPQQIAATEAAPAVPPARPAPNDTVAPRPAEHAKQEPVEPRATAAPTPGAPGAGGRSGTETSGETGSESAQSGGGLPGEMTDYMTLLQAWLERHKEYPRLARRWRQEGTAVLQFVIDRDGIVLDYSLRESSGHEALDREVLAMIERAQPLPRMPDSIHQARLELVLPVQFRLR